MVSAHVSLDIAARGELHDIDFKELPTPSYAASSQHDHSTAAAAGMLYYKIDSCLLVLIN